MYFRCAFDVFLMCFRCVSAISAGVEREWSGGGAGVEREEVEDALERNSLGMVLIWSVVGSVGEWIKVFSYCGQFVAGNMKIPLFWD